MVLSFRMRFVVSSAVTPGEGFSVRSQNGIAWLKRRFRCFFSPLKPGRLAVGALSGLLAGFGHPFVSSDTLFGVPGEAGSGFVSREKTDFRLGVSMLLGV